MTAMNRIPSGYKQTEVGVIPEDWNVGYVGDSFNVRNQLRLPISQSVRERMAGAYPYYGATGVQGWINEYRVEGVYALIGEDGDHFLKWRIQPMTLLVSGKFNVNNHAHLIQGSTNLTEWFYWFFSNRDITNYLTRQGAGRFKLSKAALIQLPCALPSPLEQRAIATALSDVDALLAAQDKLIAKKRDIKQATMQQLLTGKQRLPGFSGEWEVKTIEELEKAGIVKLSRGRVISKKDIENTPGDNPIYSSSVKNDGLFGCYGEHMFDEEMITWSVDGGGHFFHRAKHKFSVTNVCGFMRVDTAKLGYRFLAAQLQLLHSKLKFDYQDKAHPSIIRKAYSVLIPSMEEQTAIAAVFSDMDTDLTALEQQRDKTRALKQGMMQVLLTGRIRLV